MNTTQQQFASDNYAGTCPEALQALLEANASGHEPAYGDDRWTERSSNMLRELFEIDCDVYYVFNGTAANSLALAAMCQSYHSVICTPVAHVETDECGGPEFFSNGSKLLVAEGLSAQAQRGKLTPEAVEALITKRSDIHYPRPKVVSITQATELGTVYSVDEVRALSWMAKKHSLKMHMDGARFANAVAHLGCSPAEITWKAGVDVLCFGGTKNGLPVGEAVVFFTGSCRKTLPGVSNKRGNWRPKCASFRPPGWVCSKTTSGCATHATPTPWRSACTRACCRSRACRSCIGPRPMACLHSCPPRWWTPCTPKAGSSTSSLRVAAAASCVHGTPPKPRWMPCWQTSTA